ncbi:hypothetical protein LCGC14_3152120 [marine sediment metagenome]|uniref:Uncharacterized protein n=1 Tax=marine sediment metagenome TaxID=412755 RepID=A0A0F8WHT0_9ZZZZ
MTTYNAIADSAVDLGSPLTINLGGYYRDNPISMAEADASAPTVPMGRLYYAEEQKAAGTHSASVPDDAQGARRDWVEVIDTLGNDGAGGGSVGGANNTQITLPAGTYYIEAWAMAASDDANGYTHRILLYNVTDTNYDAVGSSMYLGMAGAVSNSSTLFAKITIAASKVFELRHDSSKGAPGGIPGGFASNFGGLVEVYAGFKAWQLHAG